MIRVLRREAVTELSKDPVFTDRWARLCRPDMGPFVRPVWAELWRRHFGRDSEPILIVGCDGKDLSTAWAIWPLEVLPDGSVEQLGGREITDYAGPATLPSEVSRLAREAAPVLRTLPHEPKGIHLEALPSDLGFHEPFSDALAESGASVEVRLDEACPVLDLPSSFEDYLGALDRKHRHELRRKLRRFRSEAGEPVVRRSNPASLERDLDLFFAWHRSSRGAKGGFLAKGYEGFFRDLARVAASEGWLMLSFLEVEERPLSALFAFEMEGTVFLYNAAHDPSCRSLSPGIVHLATEIRLGIERGIRQFDFLQGTERYKFELGARPRMLVTLDASF